MPEINVIAFGGKAGAGKSTCARILVNTLGGSNKKASLDERLVLAKRMSIAAPVKEIAEKMFGWAGDKTTYLNPDKSIDESKGRGLLQGIATKMRDLDPDVWIRSTIRDIHNTSWVRTHRAGQHDVPDPLNLFAIDDMRYLNEAEVLRKVFGPKALLVRVVAPGSEAIDHPGETELDRFDDWNRVIQNDGTMDDLYVEIMALLQKYQGRTA